MPWQHVNNWPGGLTAIHAVHLPNNRVVMWAFGISGSDEWCPAWVLNLETWEFFRVDCFVNNVFCAGHAMLANGSAVVAGGTDAAQPDDGEGWGTRFATALVPDTSIAGAHWEALAPMGPSHAEFGRWYPTVTELSDGQLLVLTGTVSYPPRTYNKKVQIYDPNDLNPWFTAPIEQQLPLYPAMFVLPSGLVFYAGRDITPTPPGDKTLALRLSDYTWHVVTEGQSEGAIGEHNSACSFSPSRAARSTALPSTATVASGRTVVEMCLISYACVTHGFDQNQLYIPLAFSPSGSPDTYDVVAPPNANHAPPGYYMLFVTDNTGSYSQAAKVHLSA